MICINWCSRIFTVVETFAFATKHNCCGISNHSCSDSLWVHKKIWYGCCWLLRMISPRFTAKQSKIIRENFRKISPPLSFVTNCFPLKIAKIFLGFLLWFIGVWLQRWSNKWRCSMKQSICNRGKIKSFAFEDKELKMSNEEGDWVNKDEIEKQKKNGISFEHEEGKSRRWMVK